MKLKFNQYIKKNFLVIYRPNLQIIGVAVFLGLLGLVNCKDKENPPPVDNRTKTELITLSPWKISAMVCDSSVDLDGKNGASKDMLSQRLPCQNDNSYAFNADSTTTELANLKCGNEKSPYKGTWMFTNNEKNLKWNGEDYPIMEITGTKMVVRYTLTASGIVYGITISFVH